MRFFHKTLIGGAVLIAGGVIAHFVFHVRADHLIMGLGLVAMGFSLGASE